MRRVQTKIIDQRFSKPLHRELGRAIGRVGYVGTQRCPESIHTTGVDEMAFFRCHEEGEKRTRPVVHPIPADAKGLFPGFPIVSDQASGSANPRIVEDQMNAVRFLFLHDFVSKCENLLFLGDVCQMSCDSNTRAFTFTQRFRLSHVLFRDITHRDVTAISGELPGEFAPHAGTAARDDGNLVLERIHF